MVFEIYKIDVLGNKTKTRFIDLDNVRYFVATGSSYEVRNKRGRKIVLSYESSYNELYEMSKNRYNSKKEYYIDYQWHKHWIIGSNVADEVIEESRRQNKWAYSDEI